MNDVLDFLGILRSAASIYLWSVFAIATLLLVIDLTKDRKAKAQREDSQQEKAA